MQVPHITQIESNGLNQGHQDENGDKDELVVVWQEWILQPMTTMQFNGLLRYSSYQV